MEPVTLQTERLTLDAPGAGDAALVFRYCQDPLFEQYMTLPWPYRRSDADYFVTELVPLGWHHEKEFTWALRRRAGGGELLGGELPGSELLGVIGSRVQPEHGVVDVGYWLGAPHRGRGFMAEATRAVVAWLFDARRAERVLWECVEGNVASAAVARACGFRFTGSGPGRVAMRDGRHVASWHGELRRERAAEQSPVAGWPEETYARGAQ
jgi:RimJ/RimL family protein N-acetyltransferase